MIGKHQYEAFISYSHTDKAMATWLQRNLERLRIPKHIASIQGRTSNHFRPLFRDEDELTTSVDLPETLRSVLSDSRNLIVICSPAAAQSPWVEQEVSSFRELGDPTRIFCVLIGGDPNHLESCFPPSLREGGVPLAVDLRPDGEQRSIGLLRIAASLLDVGFDDLRQRARRERRRRLSIQAVSTTGMIGLAALLSFELAVQPPCTTSLERLAPYWNLLTRSTIEQAFEATELPYAGDALAGTLRRLQGYHDAWTGMHKEACAATMVRNEQSPRLMDLRMACLDERRVEFSSLIALLENADAALVEGAVTRTGQLRSLDRCADAAQLEAAYPLPDDLAAREVIDTLRQTTAEVDAAIAAGRLDDARLKFQGIVEATQATDYPALQAQALLTQADLELASGRTSDAQETIYAAAAKAVLARDTELVAEAWLTLPQVLRGNTDEIDEAVKLIALAQSYIAQLPADHPLEARFHSVRGEVLISQGNLLEGVRDYRAAVAIGRKLDLPELGPLLTSLASGLTNLHQLAEAQTVAEEAMAITLRDFGARHPVHARSLADAARVQSSLGNRQEALALMIDAVAIEEAAYAGSSSRLAIRLQRLGWTYTQSGRYPEAIATFERVIAMEQNFPEPNWKNIAAAYNDMGDTHISVGDYDAARSSLEAALQVWQDQERVINIGIALGNLGNASNRAQRFSEAAEYCQQGLQNDEQFLPADHPDLAYPLSCLGEALMGAQQPRAALAPLARAHALRDRIDMDEASLAWTRWLYGRALVESGENPSLGMRYVIFAQDTFAGMAEVAASELADVQAWLAGGRP